jgi:isopropylmalate/homocitrate/citramalate synthase
MIAFAPNQGTLRYECDRCSYEHDVPKRLPRAKAALEEGVVGLPREGVDVFVAACKRAEKQALLARMQEVHLGSTNGNAELAGYRALIEKLKSELGMTTMLIEDEGI